MGTGTGIVAVAGASLPPRVPGLHVFATAVWALAAAALIALTGAWAVHWIRYPTRARTCRQPGNGAVLGGAGDGSDDRRDRHPGPGLGTDRDRRDLAAAITIRTFRQGLPFSLTWWSFTFPVGTCVTGTGALAAHSNDLALRWASVGLYCLLPAAWFIVAARTAHDSENHQARPDGRTKIIRPR